MQWLADAPDDAAAHAFLAEVLIIEKDFPGALESAGRAVGLNPTSSYGHYALAKAQFFAEDFAAARRSLDELRRLDPSDSEAYTLLAHIELFEKKYEAALAAAEAGLSLDSENVDLHNLRARALVKLNRSEDAAQTMDFALNRAPEDGHSHANRGWIHIERGEAQQAIESFREALRLNPDNAYAREGLKEAIRGTNPLYRQVQRYFLWAEKLQERFQWGFIIGLYLLYRVLLSLSESHPQLGFLLYPLIIFYLLFAFSTWIAVPIGNLALRSHPLGQAALTRDDILASNLSAVLLLGCVAFLVVYWIDGSELYMLIGGFCGLLLLPVGGTFSAPQGSKARKYLVAYSVVLVLLGTGYLLTAQIGVFYIFIGAFFLFQFACPYLIQRYSGWGM